MPASCNRKDELLNALHKILAPAVVAAGLLGWVAGAHASDFVQYDAGAEAASSVSLDLHNVPLKEAAEKVATLGAVEVRVSERIASERITLVSGEGLGGAALSPVFSSVLLSLGYIVETVDGALVVTKPMGIQEVDIVLNPEELEADFKDIDTGSLLTVLMPTMAQDDDGNVIGLTGNLGNLPVSEKLGLKNGDILHRLNGVLIDNMMVVMQLADQFDGDSFNATIIRDGEPIQLNYTINR